MKVKVTFTLEIDINELIDDLELENKKEAAEYIRGQAEDAARATLERFIIE